EMVGEEEMTILTEEKRRVIGSGNFVIYKVDQTASESKLIKVEGKGYIGKLYKYKGVNR
ncbi:hypothetical protein MIMGU_mgv1a0010612mg, partial [Erythranthe guttata]